MAEPPGDKTETPYRPQLVLNLESKNGWKPEPRTASRACSSGEEAVPDCVRTFATVELANLDQYGRMEILDAPEKRFQRIRTIGKGNCATVSLAIDTQSGTHVAIKSLLTMHEANLKLLTRELEALQHQYCLPASGEDAESSIGSSRDRNIIEFYGFFMSPDRTSAHLVLEYMSCGSLHDIIHNMESSGQCFPEQWGSAISKHVLSALIVLRAHGQVHRDLKPSNILIGRDGSAKLSDFGVSRRCASEKCSSFVGTLAFMSPERLRGQLYSENSDVWSFGVCLASCFLGRCPFEPSLDFWGLLSLLKPSTIDRLLDRLRSHDVSGSALNFIAACLQCDYRTRPGARELLLHPFVSRSAHWSRDHWTELLAAIGSEATSASAMCPRSGKHLQVCPQGRPEALSQSEHASPMGGEPRLRSPLPRNHYPRRRSFAHNALTTQASRATQKTFFGFKDAPLFVYSDAQEQRRTISEGLIRDLEGPSSPRDSARRRLRSYGSQILESKAAFRALGALEDRTPWSPAWSPGRSSSKREEPAAL